MWVLTESQQNNVRCLKNRVHDAVLNSVFTYDDAFGKFERCDFYASSEDSLFEVKDGSDPLVVDCKFHDTGKQCVDSHSNGKGRFERCDFSTTAHGACMNVFRGGNPIVTDCT